MLTMRCFFGLIKNISSKILFVVDCVAWNTNKHVTNLWYFLKAAVEIQRTQENDVIIHLRQFQTRRGKELYLFSKVLVIKCKSTRLGCTSTLIPSNS